MNIYDKERPYSGYLCSFIYIYMKWSNKDIFASLWEIALPKGAPTSCVERTNNTIPPYQGM
jgi:hypothetical protein